MLHVLLTLTTSTELTLTVIQEKVGHTAANFVIIYFNDHCPQHACTLPDTVLHQAERLTQYMHKKKPASLQAAWSG